MDLLRQKRVEQENKKTSGLKKRKEKKRPQIPESGPLDWNADANHNDKNETLLQEGKIQSTSALSQIG